ncbi:hypothetical protein IQ06DRAFT_309694 [Phaeosphaeriaceae sp. SRC1lsM3a]|nr:hypothetical protein IQ06DRAFT_309694 [Stagonospora sp. SRC1lsM3a]
MGPLGQCDNPIVRSHHSSLTSHGTRSSTLMLNPRILSTRPKQAARTNLEFYLTESGRKMQRTTINSYPHLVEIKPIKGIVYKASNILRPQPTISVMPIYEVQMHQKQEGVTAVMQKDKPQSKLFRLKKRLGHECMLCSVSESSSTLPEDLESLPPPIPLVQQPNAQKALGGKAIKSLRKWKKPTIQPSSAESMSSGFTTTTTGSTDSSVVVSSSPTNLDVFQDFDGTHIEATPPQIAPLRPLSSFVVKLQESVFTDANWSLVDFSEIEGYTERTTPDRGREENPYPTPSASGDE